MLKLKIENAKTETEARTWGAHAMIWRQKPAAARNYLHNIVELFAKRGVSQKDFKVTQTCNFLYKFSTNLHTIPFHHNKINVLPGYRIAKDAEPCSVFILYTM